MSWKSEGFLCAVRLASALLLLQAAVVEASGLEPAASRGPQRIITIAPNSAEILAALGAADRLVAVSKFCVYPPELADKTRIGGLFDPDLEKIMALRPDLVVLRGNCEPVERMCRKINVAVYRDRTETLRDVPSCVRELGSIVGKGKEADELVARFNAGLDAVRRRVAKRNRPRVLITVARQPARLANILTAGKGNFLDDAIAIAGGENVFGDLDMAWPQVSIESIVTRAPDVIIELMPEQEASDSFRQRMLAQWGRLGSVPAVKNGRVLFITDDHCLIPSLRYVEIVAQLSHLLHPEKAIGE